MARGRWQDPALTKDKKREILQKILHPERFGKTRIGLSGKRRRINLQPQRIKGDAPVEDANEAVHTGPFVTPRYGAEDGRAEAA